MRRAIFFILAAAMVAATWGASSRVSSAARDANQPYYRGKSLQQWSNALQDQNPAIRQRAAAAIGQMDLRARTSAPQLGELLQGDPDVEVRQEAARTLLGMASAARGQIPALIAALKDSDLDVRTSACRALGAMGIDAGVAASDLAHCLSSSDASFAGEAASALSSLGDAGDAALLSAAKTENASSRHECLRGVGERVHPSPADVSTLQEALADGAPALRAIAAEGLGHFGALAAPASSALARCLTDRDARVRLDAAQALAAIGPDAQPALGALQLALRAPAIASTAAADGLFRVSAARAVWSIAKESRAVLPTFLKACSSDDPAVRAAAITGLGETRDASSAALQCITDGLVAIEGDVRVASIHALARVGPGARGEVVALRGMLASKQAQLVLLAAQAVWQIDQNFDEIEPVVTTLLSSPDWTARDGAASMIGDFGLAARGLVPRLRQCLGDASAYVRISAAMALWRITLDPDESMRTLLAIAGNVDSPDGFARALAIATLGKIGSGAESAKPALQKLEADDFASVRAAAHDALGRIEQSPKSSGAKRP